MERFKSIAKIEGNLLLIVGLFMLIPLIMSLILAERAAATGFVVAILCCAVFFFLSLIISRDSKYVFKYRDGFFIVTIGWIFACIIGSLPFIISGCIPNFFDAFFESSSGFSTTGASVIVDVESLPKSILFWRSLTHFLGGMGILVLLSAILPSWGVTGQSLAFTESTGPSGSKVTAKFSETARALYTIYIAMTVIEIILLKIGNMSWFDSFIHAFGTVGTGGFSSYNNGLMHFDSLYVKIVITLFMFLAGTNFNLFYLAKKRGIRQIFKDEEFRFYFIIVSLATLGICVANFFTTTTENVSFIDALFQSVSIITTTGYVTCDYDLWSSFAKMTLLSLFLIGACAQSTSGGIKSIRILVSIKLVKRSFSLKLHPNRFAKITLNGSELPTDTIIRISTFILTYITILLVGTLMLSFSGNDFITNLTASMSCLGNVGPGFGGVGPTHTYADFTGYAKLICSLLMIIGRLEVLTVFTLFSRHYWNPDRVY